VDEDFSKQQLDLMLRDHNLHPSGQIPAYDWNFGDVNPPVHAWATMFTYTLDKSRRGQGDLDWLEGIFHKLLLNFTWWVNRKDRSGKSRRTRTGATASPSTSTSTATTVPGSAPATRPDGPTIAPKASQLRELGLSDRVIAARLGVTDKRSPRRFVGFERPLAAESRPA
jgi:hypothetical protein